MRAFTYSRFSSDRELLEKVRIRLVEYIETTFDTAPTKLQDIHSRETLRSASDLERQQVNNKLLSGLDNEIMFSSPGLFPGGQSIDRISRGDACFRVRNSMIVQGLRWLEYMDERGSGIRRMRFAMKEKKLPVPQFPINNGEFSVTLYDTLVPDVVQPATTAKENIRIAPTPDNAVESKEVQLIQLVRANGSATTAMCVQTLGFSRDAAWRLLSRLTKEGVLKKTGFGRGTRYYLNKAPDQA